MKGSDRILYLFESGEFVPVGCLVSDSFYEETEMLDTTTQQNNGWTTSVPTNQSFSVDFDAIIVVDESFISYVKLVNIKRNRELRAWKMETINGEIAHVFNAYIASLGDTAQEGDMYMFSGSLTGWGKPNMEENYTDGFDYNFDFNLS